MLRLLSPFFIGRKERGLDRKPNFFDQIVCCTHDSVAEGSIEMISEINRAIRDFIIDAFANDASPFVLSGDCLSAIGCFAGVQASGIDASLIWLDAHGDFHTPESTTSGHLGGMPLAMIAGRGDLSLLRQCGLLPLPPSKIFHVGARDLDPGESDSFYSSGIGFYSDISEMKKSVATDSSFWLHFDTDYINPVDAPAMRYPAPGGASTASIKSDLMSLCCSRKIIGISVSAWAPHLDAKDETAGTCWDIFSDLI